MLILFGYPLPVVGDCVNKIVVRGLWVMVSRPQPFHFPSDRMRKIDQATIRAMLRPLRIRQANVLLIRTTLHGCALAPDHVDTAPPARNMDTDPANDLEERLPTRTDGKRIGRFGDGCCPATSPVRKMRLTRPELGTARWGTLGLKSPPRSPGWDKGAKDRPRLLNSRTCPGLVVCVTVSLITIANRSTIL